MADPAAACMAEIVAMHDLFEAVLGARAEDDGGRFDAAFAPDFSMVVPSGRKLDRAEVLAFLRGARGSRGPDFRIAIEEVAVLCAAPPLMLMQYVERQWLAGGIETARRAAVLFRMRRPSPSWLFVQETWITPPPD